MQKFTPFLMFEGKAEAAINFYISLFSNSEIVRITRYGPDQPGDEGTVMHALFTLGGQEFMCIDSNISHEFTFTPSMSIYVQCESDDEIDRLFAALSESGNVMMPLDSYPFSARYAWISDRFGVSWQLNLAHGKEQS
jgi:predicted 3-demethylubiquinone-9 3-methyltransferase (glyoxalase superfamily)